MSNEFLPGRTSFPSELQRGGAIVNKRAPQTLSFSFVQSVKPLIDSRDENHARMQSSVQERDGIKIRAVRCSHTEVERSAGNSDNIANSDHPSAPHTEFFKEGIGRAEPVSVFDGDVKCTAYRAGEYNATGGGRHHVVTSQRPEVAPAVPCLPNFVGWTEAIDDRGTHRWDVIDARRR
jgi:hypothetical protein